MSATERKSAFSAFISDFVAGFSANFAKNRAKYAKKQQKLRQNFQNSYKIAKNHTFLSVNSSRIIRPLSVAVLSFVIGLSAGLVFNPAISTNAAEQGITIGLDQETTKGLDQEASASSGQGTTISPEQNSPVGQWQSINTTTKIIEKPAVAAKSLSEIADSTINSLTSTTNSTYTTTQTGIQTSAVPATQSTAALQISSIGLYTGVIPTYVNSSNNIVVPSSTVGALTSYNGRTFINKTMLVGHRAGIFSALSNVRYGDTIFYYGKSYTVTNITQLSIADTQAKMSWLIKDEAADTIVLMTCAGYNNSERLIITAVAD